MKPIRLEVEHLRNFRQKSAIDFTGLEIFAILGDTGAGKTSILEAITYALFNRPTWNGRDVKELITKSASAMSVAFTFSVGEDEYTIQRITRLRGASLHRLMCPTRGIDVNGEAAVNAAVQAALHLDDEAFVHTVMLRQDMHAALLTASESKRTAILSELFRLDDVAKVADLARTHEGEAERYLYSFQTRRNECGDDPEAKLQAAEESLQSANELAARANIAVETAKNIDQQIVECAKIIDRTRTEELTLAPASKLMHELEEIEAIEREVAPQIAERRKDQERAETEKHAAENEAAQLRSSGRDTDTLRKVETALETLHAELREISNERTREGETASNADVIEKRVHDLRLVVTAAEGEYTAAVSALTAAETALREQETRKNELQIVLQDRANVAGRRESWLSSRSTKAAQEMNLRESLVATKKALNEAQQACEAAVGAHAQAQVADQAAAIAHHLHVGDDCPVCHRKLPKDFTPPHRPALEKAKKAEDQAKKQLAALAAEKNQLDGQLIAATKSLGEATDQLAKAESELASISQRVQGMLPAPKNDPNEVLAEWQKAIAEGQRQVPALRATVDQKNKTSSEVRAKLTTAEADLRNARGAIDSLRSSIAARMKRCETIASSLPKAFQPKLAEPDLQGTLVTLRACDGVANSVDSRIRFASEAIVAASTKINELEQQFTSRVVVPRETLYEKLRVIGALLVAPALPVTQEERSKWARSVVTDAAATRLRLEEEAVKASTRRDELAQTRATLVKELGGEPQAVASQVALRKRDAERDAEAAKRTLEFVASLDTKIERLQPIKAGLTNLRTALGAREFPAYATQQRQRRLLEEATIIFREMTDDRYGFTADFEIFDREMNKARSPETLSGGEKFLASLALSLAVVEIASNAGAKIEALFLDEGFASLDAQTLELAMLELRKRSRTGRMICVISHLSQVAQFVNDTIVVEETADGSKIARRSGPIDDDDSSAAEGLVSHLAAS